MEINGIAHIFLTSGNYTAARDFYGKLLPFLGLTEIFDTEESLYYVGGRTAVGVQASDRQQPDNRFDQQTSGLHHVCFRVRAREDIDELHAFLLDLGTRIVHGPQEDGWAPGYYSVLFEDPDGVRLEANFVPGKGLLN